MSVLYIMLPAALLVAGAALGAFILATRAGQFDDLDTPAYRMLPDDDTPNSAHAVGSRLEVPAHRAPSALHTAAPLTSHPSRLSAPAAQQVEPATPDASRRARG